MRARSEARRPAAPAARAPIAFFDFDNTLIHGDAGPRFGWYLFRERQHDLTGRFWRRLRLWVRYLPYLTWMGVQAILYALHARRRSSIIRASYKGLRGLPAEPFYHLMEDFAREALAPRLYPEMVAEVRRHHELGHRCVVITTGIESLVRRVLDRVDPRIDLIGCRLLEDRGRLTGHVEGPLFGVDKANILDAYCRPLGVARESCWAYSDHWSDKAMLEAVGHPVTVNPRGRLLRRARKHGWQVIQPRLGRE